MYVIGKASEAEIEIMKAQGWEVEEVNQASFNKALDPSYDPDKDLDLDEPQDGERLVCIYTTSCFDLS